MTDLFDREWLEMFAFASLGALFLWIRLKYGTSLQVSLEEFVTEFTDNFSRKGLATLLFFVIFGAIIGLTLAEPSTKKQALAAGMAWTAMLGSLANPTKKTGIKRADEAKRA